MAKRKLKNRKLRVVKDARQHRPRKLNYAGLLTAITESHNQAQRQAAQFVNSTLTIRNWLIGFYIVEYQQRGNDRAIYGEDLLKRLAQDLKSRLGRGFGWRNLFQFREFYQHYPILQSLIAKFAPGIAATGETARNAGIPIAQSQITQFDAPSPSLLSSSITPLDWQDEGYFTRLFNELSWTHFIELTRIDDPFKRAFYEVETLKNRWSVRELKRQMDSLLYERVGLSRNKQGVLELAKLGEVIVKPQDLIRDPYVFEFLGLKHDKRYTESQLETALLDNLQDFLLEFGKGFCFIARQCRITFDNEHYYIDLLLFNRRLKCLVAIDLILGPFRHNYAGAMNFYLNYLKAEECEPDEEPPIGLILCSDKNETHVEYALGGLDNHVFVSRYLLYLPSQEQLEAFVAQTRARLEK
jgi:predicted nuclease of restriction endonuclease-like (RecB) superfamily